MKLSAPIHHLKRAARLLSREKRIPLHEALDRIAAREGYSAWSLLAKKFAESSPAAKLLARLKPGDLVLIGARPRQGKTLMGLELAMEAANSGRRSIFFTLEYTEADVLDCLCAIGVNYAKFDRLFELDCSDAINADHIMKSSASALRGTLVIVDYLQVLDQKRENPELAVQVSALKQFARDQGLIMVFLSQIDRSYDSSTKPFPDMGDVRLPNPVDLRLFNNACFLSKGQVRFRASH